MSDNDDGDFSDTFPVFCTANIPTEASFNALTRFLAKGHEAENEDLFPTGSIYIMKPETEDPASIVRPTQPPIEAFESSFLSSPVKKALKVAGFNCVILDDRTCTNGTCLLLSDTPAGSLYDEDLPRTARCEVGFALDVLGDCEIMNGDLAEYNMNYGDDPKHLLRDKDGKEDDAGKEGADEGNDHIIELETNVRKGEDVEGEEEDELEEEEVELKEDEGAEVEENGGDGDREMKEQRRDRSEEEQSGQTESGKEGANQGETSHRTKRRRVSYMEVLKCVI